MGLSHPTGLHWQRHNADCDGFRERSAPFDPCAFARFAPPWLKERSFDTLKLTVRLANFVNYSQTSVLKLAVDYWWTLPLIPNVVYCLMPGAEREALIGARVKKNPASPV